MTHALRWCVSRTYLLIAKKAMSQLFLSGQHVKNSLKTLHTLNNIERSWSKEGRHTDLMYSLLKKKEFSHFTVLNSYTESGLIKKKLTLNPWEISFFEVLWTTMTCSQNILDCQKSHVTISWVQHVKNSLKTLHNENIERSWREGRHTDLCHRFSHHHTRIFTHAHITFFL